MKIEFDSLVFEITRKCNMNCAHCLRGDAQNVDIDYEVIDRVLDKTEAIRSITLSGGEISLNVSAMEYILNACKTRGISICDFYFVTNGKVVKEEFLMTILKWFCYVAECGGETECCGLALSKDDFHEKIPFENEMLLKGFSFSVDDKVTDFKRIGLLNCGRARNLTGYPKRELEDWRGSVSISRWNDNITSENTIYVTAKGDILSCCDCEYDDPRFKIANCFEDDWMEKIEKAGSRVEEEPA